MHGWFPMLNLSAKHWHKLPFFGCSIRGEVKFFFCQKRRLAFVAADIIVRSSNALWDLFSTLYIQLLSSSDAILLESEGALNSSPSSSFAAFKMETQLQVHHQLMKGRLSYNSILFGFCFCFFSFIFDDKFKTFAVRSRVQTQTNQRQHTYSWKTPRQGNPHNSFVTPFFNGHWFKGNWIQLIVVGKVHT